MIGVGVSTGGMAMVGLAANPPPGMIATISFAGGRGSRSPDFVCNPDVLVDAFSSFGKHARVPMLWVYATNDHYFGPGLAQEFNRAYTQSGGNARFILTEPFGQDGHHLFSLGGIPTWTPIVDDFLKAQGLVLRETLLDIPKPAVDPPSQLTNDNAREQFDAYLLSAPHKAFAVSGTGHFAASSGRRSVEEAKKSALQQCKKDAPKGDPCVVVMIEDEKALQ